MSYEHDHTATKPNKEIIRKLCLDTTLTEEQMFWLILSDINEYFEASQLNEWHREQMLKYFTHKCKTVIIPALKALKDDMVMYA